ncbi:hypothetical protein SteCoe_2754 [Stentor coeruleus]|uniref:Uncharacterized protein n=1 Tax=Stentor coeruleus TaxID=5963 RepID=A0A1R2CYQ5_9CILI|nr:hypothetical protein SteCoe_2754 [Stentor coeruleus]
MGCTSSRDETLSEEELLIKTCEKSLGFQNHLSKTLLSSFISYTSENQILLPDLLQALNKLDLENIETNTFINHFLYNNRISIKKLNCLAILLGSSKKPEKIQLLFDNYNEDIRPFLYKNELETLISHILYINLSAIPSYTLSKNPNNFSLGSYTSKLNFFINSLLKHFLHRFLGTRSQISYFEFEESFENPEIEYLLNGKNLRVFCKNIFSKGKKQHKKNAQSYSQHIENLPENNEVHEKKEKGPFHKISLSIS